MTDTPITFATRRGRAAGGAIRATTDVEYVLRQLTERGDDRDDDAEACRRCRGARDPARLVIVVTHKGQKIFLVDEEGLPPTISERHKRKADGLDRLTDKQKKQTF